MADPYGLELSGLDPADSAELRKIKNRQALADQMTQIGLTPIRGTMAGRVYAAPSWTQGLAQLASAYVGKKMTDEADEGYKGVAERQKQRIADEMMKVKDLYHGKEAITPATPMDDEGNKMPMVQEAQAPNPRAAIEQAMLSNSPMLQRYGMMLNQGEESKLARAENAANRAEMYKLQVEENKRRDAQRADDKENMIRLAASLKPPREPTAPIQVADDKGNVKLYDRAGNLVKDLGNVGKVSGSTSKLEATRKKGAQELDTAIRNLEAATKDGGLIDQSTGSGIGAGVDWLARQVGTATPGDIAVGRMAPIYDQVLKMVPRFEGPQSDKDTALYERAAGDLANPAVPNAKKKAAAKEILRLMKDRKGQFSNKDVEAIEMESGAAPSSFSGSWKDL